MNQPFFYYFSNYSIVIAAVIALFKFKKAAPAYLPFFIFIWLGLGNEILSQFTGRYFRNTNVNNNVYVLLESLLLLWLFSRWKLFDRHPNLPKILAASFILVWLAEVLLISNIKIVAGYFRVYYSFAIVLISVSMINKLITEERGNLLKNACFIICIGFIVYFTNKILVEIFYLYGLMSNSKEFRFHVYDVMRAVNLFSNLIYAVALLWIPRKNSSLMPSSYQP